LKQRNFVEDLPMIIPGQLGFNCPSGFREEAFWNIFPIGFNVKLSPAVAEAKLYMNWVILYKLYAFCSRMKFKMAATAGLSLTLNPMGKKRFETFFP
jgi:hypothetical protein